MTRLNRDDLHQQLSQYRDMVGFAVDAILTGDQQGNLTSANQSMTRMTGYAMEELFDMNVSQLFTEAEHKRTPLRYDLLQKGEVVVAERFLRCKDGSSLPVEMKSRMLPDGTYHAFIRDLSERRQAEEALRLSEEKFSRAFHLSPDAINITRLRDATFLDVNEGFTSLIGWSKDEVIGHSAMPGDLDIWRYEEERQQLISELQEKESVHGARVTLRRKDGAVGIGLMSARVIDIGGEACILAITRDITEQEELRKEKERLEAQMLQVQKLESLGVMAGGIAHDFNNILMAVLGHCELAQRRVSPDSQARKNLDQIKLSVSKASELANQMLAYSGKGQFVIRPCDLSSLIDEMQEMLKISVSRRAQLSFELADKLPCVEGDLTQLQQIVMNLVINASDALEEKPGTVKVSSGRRSCGEREIFQVGSDQSLPAGEYIFLEVADSGCGMDEVTRQRIFDPFFTTKFTGRGLGMAAVLGIVRGHGGGLEIETSLGVGTRISVFLPASAEKSVSVEDDRGPVEWQQSGLVLLADDDPAVLSTGRQMLEELGFRVVTAVDGEDALQVFRQQQEPLRFALLDLTMPQMGDEEALLSLRHLSPGLPVIISSGFNEQEMSAGLRAQEQLCFLKKPYQLGNLQQSIIRLLNL